MINNTIGLLIGLIKLYPDNALIQFLLAQAYLELKDYDNALNSIIESIRINPDNSDSYTIAGNIQAKYYKDYDAAIASYVKALELDPKNYIAMSNLAGAYYHSETELEKAIILLANALALKPSHGNAYYIMALIYMKLNKPKVAMEAIRVGLEWVTVEDPAHVAMSALYKELLLL